MPAYSYKERFVSMVKDGSKPHTIRARRKNFAKKGSPLYHYFGMRTKYCTKLAEDVCADVKTIVITDTEIYLFNRRIDNEDAFDLLDSLQNYPDWLSLRLKEDEPDYRGHTFHCLNPAQRDQLAWLDGFRPGGSTLTNPCGAFALMNRFWIITHELPFVGDIIYRSINKQ